jgi:hypothetical protein
MAAWGLGTSTFSIRAPSGKSVDRRQPIGQVDESYDVSAVARSGTTPRTPSDVSKAAASLPRLHDRPSQVPVWDR